MLLYFMIRIGTEDDVSILYFEVEDYSCVCGQFAAQFQIFYFETGMVIKS